MNVEKLQLGDFGDEVVKLQEELISQGLKISPEEMKRKFYGPSTRTAVQQFLRKKKTGEDERTKPSAEDKPVTVIDPTHKPTPESNGNNDKIKPGGSGRKKEEESRSITGRVFLRNGLPAEGLALKLYRHGFGNEALLAETVTESLGRYSLPFNDAGRLAISIKAVTREKKEILLLKSKYVEKKQQEINLLAPAGIIDIEPEYNRLMSSVTPFLGDRRLGEAKEGDDNRDLSWLFQQTGWDARLLAMAAMADKRSADTGVAPEILYGLFRTGLPTGTEQLSRVKETTVVKSLEKANKAGIVNVNVEAARNAVIAFTTRKLRTEKLVGGIGNIDDFLKDIQINGEASNQLASMFFREELRGDAFWQKAKEKGIPEAAINKMKTQGKLSFLTLNNPHLTGKLQKELGDRTEISALAEKGYFKAEKWKQELEELAGGDEKKLQEMIPTGYMGKPAEALDTYANDMAKKIRTAYPTQTLSAMITSDGIRLGRNHDKIKAGVGQLLKNAASLKMEAGSEDTYVPGSVSFHTFLNDNRKQLLKGVDEGIAELCVSEAKKLTRLYQLSPTDESMQILYNLGFTSAFEIAAIPHDDWVKFYGPEFGTHVETEQIYHKSQTTTSVLYNFYTAGQLINTDVPTGGTSGSPEEREVIKNNLIKRFPTLEALFGSLDFCDCEHCRSVLSPAAYLVDILRFLDPDENDWETMKLLWKKKHNDTAYTGQKPFEVLNSRRSDIPLIQLNCENTNTALPYIDIVNEIMECYVACKEGETAAYDTGDNTSADLLAEPQNILPEAYDTLNKEVYPLTLPFDYPLQLVRSLGDHFDIPLWKLLSTFRKTDELFAGGPAASWYFSDTFFEYLGLSAKELELFTRPQFDKWFLLYGYTLEADALSSAIDTDTRQVIGIVSAKTLSRKLGITYKELVRIIKLHFINPALEDLALLRSLHLTTEDVHRWKSAAGYTPFNAEESAVFEARLAAATSTSFNARAWVEKFWNDNVFGKTILLFDTEPGGNFDKTRLQFANGDPLTSLEWVKINLFIRLWRKLGWKLEEMDTALVNFLPAGSAPSTANFGDKFKTALVYLSHLKRLQETYPLGKTGIQAWSSLWGSFARGSQSLYQRYFLAGSITSEDPIYKDPLGKYLQSEKAGTFVPFAYDPLQAEDRLTGNVALKNHLASVQSALGLTGDEIRMVLEGNGKEPESAPLDMTVLQLLNGFKVLKEATRMSVKDLLSLQKLSGLSPLKPLTNAPLASLDEDYPYTQTLRFLETAATIKDTGLLVAKLNYLLRHSFDAEDPAINNEGKIVAFIRSLSAEINRIGLEQSPPPDTTGYTDEFMQERILLALSPGIAGTFLAMWNDTIALSASETTLPADKLPATLLEDDKRVSVSYDATRQVQTLAYTGVPDAARVANITTKLNAAQALPAADPKRITAAQKALALSLLANIAQQSKVFYEEHLLKPIFRNDAAHAFTSFFPVINATDTEPEQQAMKNAKRMSLVNATLLFLKKKFGEEAVVNQLASAFNLDSLYTKYLLNDTNVAAIETKTLQQVFSTANTAGVSIHFIKNTANKELSGPPVFSQSAGIAAADVPASTTCIVIAGYLETTVAGAYRFFVKGSRQAMKLKLSMTHLAKPLIDGTLATDNAELSEFVDLEAGVAYKFSLEITGINGGNVVTSVQSEVLPKGELTRMKIIPQELVDTIGKAYTLLGKIADLITTFKLEESEVRYLSGYPTDHYQFSFPALPTALLSHTVAADKAVFEKLFNQFSTLVSYSRLKKEIAGGGPGIAALLESVVDNQPGTLQIIAENLAALMRRDRVIIDDIITYFGYDAFSFSRGEALEKIWEAVKQIHKMGISVSSVTKVLPLVSRTATFTEKFDLAIAFKQTLKSRYPRDSWNQVAKSIFDNLRQQKRDALSAHIMHKENFAGMGQLFEFFLIDPGMEPVVLTSRIRLAIASVQSFVQRCLLNLEPGVSASLINRRHWEWMKRYRVWEANRKIFLFPENWLEPEFRDDKTHLFEELEGTILQGDINKDLVERAFYNYLKGLERIARLNMVAMYCEKDPIDITHNKIHVIAKEFSQPSYYYRSYSEMEWTPWVPIPDQIEGEHLALIKWQDRLHVFWLTFLPKSESSLGADENVEDAAKKKQSQLVKNVVEIQLNWCEYYQGEWLPRQTGGFENAMIAEVPFDFTTNDVYVHVSIEMGPSPAGGNESVEKAVLVHVTGENINQAFRLVSKLAIPVADSSHYASPASPPYVFAGNGKTKYKWTGGSFMVVYTISILKTEETVNGVQTVNTTVRTPVEKDLFKFPEMRIMNFLFCNEPLVLSETDEEINRLVSPFFFEDNEESITLYAEPDFIVKTTETWEDWIIKETTTTTVYDNDDYWVEIQVEPLIPYILIEDFKKAFDPKVNPYSEFSQPELINPVRDWLVRPETIVQFNETLLGAKGGVILEQPGKGNGFRKDGMPGKQVSVVNMSADTGFNSGTAIVKELSPGAGEYDHGVTNVYAGNVTVVNIIGAGGMNSSLFNKTV